MTCACKSCSLYSSMPSTMCTGQPYWVRNLRNSMLICWEWQGQFGRNCDMLFMARHQTTSKNRCFSGMGCVLLQRCSSTGGWYTSGSFTGELFPLYLWSGVCHLWYVLLTVVVGGSLRLTSVLCIKPVARGGKQIGKRLQTRNLGRKSRRCVRRSITSICRYTMP